MPTLQWDPRPTIKKFMTDKQRRDCSNVIERSAKQVPFFKGIFDAATDEADIEELPDFGEEQFD